MKYIHIKSIAAPGATVCGKAIGDKVVFTREEALKMGGGIVPKVCQSKTENTVATD